MSDFTWKIGGEAGFGIMTTGLAFSKIASRLGYEVFENLEYPSLIRGGHNSYEVTFSQNEVCGIKPTLDCLVCLNEETFKLNKERLTSSTFVIYDENEFKPEGDFLKIKVPFSQILTDLKGQVIMKNTIAMGATIAVFGSDLSVFTRILEEQFGRKGAEVVEFNKRFAEEGFNFVKKNYLTLVKKLLIKPSSTNVPGGKLVMTGNDAFSLGAVIADCRVYAAYPMTPSSTVLTNLAGWQEKVGMIVRHAEDEISVINTAIGSSFAGVRSAVGTSGGGFALMVEAISLAGITEIPLVIFVAQRPGPATGMPTWTEQGDLLFTVNAGHGEFPKIVLAPGGLEEMIELTAKAFNLADIYQTPVIVLSDMFLSENHRTISQDYINKFISSYKINRGKLINKITNDQQPISNKYLRYQITDDGISPRLIPGTLGYFYQANSYEHLEDGHTTEESVERIKQVDKRARKIQTYLKNDFSMPKIFGDLDNAEIVFVCWGSTKRPVLKAQELLKEKKIKSAVIHFTHVYPLDQKKVRSLLNKTKRYILVENNSTGQFGKLLTMETGIEIENKILRYDGRPITAEEIVHKVIKL